MFGRLGARSWILLSALSIMLSTSAVRAIPPNYRIAQLYHAQWNIQRGAPTGIQSMAQTNDGFLWLGAAGGLFRFDGVQFERFTTVGGVSLQSRDVYTLQATTEGGLWIGFRSGGASYLLNRTLVNYGESEGLPGASVTAFATSADGTVWIGTTRGLYRRERDHWLLAGADWNVPERFIFSVISDREQVLWVLSESKVFYLRPSARQFERLPVIFEKELESASLLLRKDGTAAICTRENFGVLKLVVPSQSDPYVPDWNHRQGMPGELGACVYDRDSHLWVASLEGASRFPSERAAVNDAQDDLGYYKAGLVPLTGTVVSSALEDREGNIWFSTNSGLDQFRAPTLSKMPLPAGTYSVGLARAGTQGMWVTTNSGYTYRVYRDEFVEQFKRQSATAPYDVSAIASDGSGNLWIGWGDEITHRTSDGQWQGSVRPPASTGRDYDNIQSIAVDARGNTWVSVPRIGVYRVVGKKWTLTQARTDNPSDTAIVLYADAQDRIWAGYADGSVIVYEGEHSTTLMDSKQKLGTVYAFAQQRDAIWIGSERGLWRTDGKSLVTIDGREGPLAVVTGIIPSSTGELWLTTAVGVAYVTAAEVAQTFKDHNHPMQHKLLNYLDGLPGSASTTRPHPKAAADSDGHIWFAGTDGVAWMNPAQLPHNDVVPNVVVKSLVADGVEYELDSNAPVTLQPRARNLQISYTAPSLTIPERVTFRYRLADDDPDWLDVGTRREAYFTDLPPGTHRFQVLAANDDGVWNETGASILFVIPPTFVQTFWFRLLCALVGVAAMVILFQLRLRAVKSRMGLRMQEREHIARELHDTFLQAVQGLMLRFQSAMERIPRHEPSRAMMEDALDRADRVLEEGRNAVSTLRARSSSPTDLVHNLREAADAMAEERGMEFVLIEIGQPRELTLDVQHEIQRIAGEALANAFHHSQSPTVTLQISYSRSAFSLQVSDRGRGFEPERSHVGHWGLVGMRERTTRMRGRLVIDSGAHGTTIVLEIPARVAYASARRGGVLRRLIS